MQDCVFCKIARGELPSATVYEDDDVVSFDDTNPQAPVHALIVPRAHFERLSDAVPDHILAALMRAVSEVARAKGIATSGYRVIINAGSDAKQSVPHLHLHVLGGREMSHGMVRFSGREEDA